MNHESADVVVIGGGAAGMLCAAEAGHRGRRVLLLERSDRIGKKILISGGGRCNFTNLHSTFRNFISENPDFCRSALAGFPPRAFIRRVEQAGIPYHEKKAGQLFCDDSARQIVSMLEKDCANAGVSIRTSADVDQIQKGSNGFTIQVSNRSVRCASLVIATGGPSIPKMGASAWGYDIARQFGLAVVEPRPALVPLVWGTDELVVFGGLSGLSAGVEVRCGRQSFRESMLFTHRGISGPAILQISSYWKKGDPIVINFLPDTDVAEWLGAQRKSNRSLSQILAGQLPERLATALSGKYAPQKTLNHYTNAEFQNICRQITEFECVPAGNEGFDKAEVTRGGVDTRELSSKTMECQKVPGLFFIGEVVDVTGHLGGHNFQWAWASGFAAGRTV